MAEEKPEIVQPFELKVNPRKWTTKVNVAVIVAVAALMIIGLVYGVLVTRDSPNAPENAAPADKKS